MMYTQPVNREDLSNIVVEKPFNMIDNYIYLYHTDTLIVLPLYPESIQDSMATTYARNTPMLRSAPIFSFSNAGPRSFSVTLPIHRDIMDSVNIESTSMFKSKIDLLSDEDYTDLMINQLQSAALPKYASAEKMVNPPLIAVRFGNSLFCKGVIDGGITTEHSGPILNNNKYALVTVSFTIVEVDPYDAETVAVEGGFRGLRTTLETLFK